MSEEQPVDWGLPRLDADSKPFWEAVQQGRLLVKTCSACSHCYFPPRPLCPRCWSEATQWRECSGRGEIHSLTVVTRPVSDSFVLKPPYVVALVSLEEGPRIMSNIVGEGCLSAAIGDRVRLRFEPRTADFRLPVFELAGAHA